MEENYGVYEFIGRVQNLTTVIRILDYELYTMIKVAMLSKEGKSNLYYWSDFEIILCN